MPAHRWIDKAGAGAPELRFKSDDHTVLVAQAWGDASHRPVILLHGGGQTRHAWKNTAFNLVAHGFYAIAVDLRGHGDSGWSANGRFRCDAVPDFSTAKVGNMIQSR